jgi:ABC-2 type transport system permease protein
MTGERWSGERWTGRETVAQFRAIAWLRWRILVNSFRRTGGGGELAARLIIYPILTAFALLPTLGAGGGAYFFAHRHHLDRVAWILWAIFVLCQMLNINLGQPGTTFDPRLLIRFPMRLRDFVAIRLFFGLLSPANVLGTMMAVAVALGVSIALPALWLYAFAALAVFASANVLFSRMVFAWVDRWLSTRRAREIFTALIFAGSLAIQWINVSVNPVYNHGRRAGALGTHLVGGVHVARRLEPLLAFLPPELTASSLVAARAGRMLGFCGFTLACLLFSVAFLLVFSLRMRTEFGGENLSDAANALPPAARKQTAAAPANHLRAPSRPAGVLSFRHTVAAVLGKEFLYLRRNFGLFYSLIAPVVMVFLFAGRLSLRSSGAWTFPAALAYTLLGVVPLCYNSFGLEGTGAQLYFMAPVRLRDVVLAKNLLNLLLGCLEMIAVLAIVTYTTRLPPLSLALAALLWAAATLLVSMAIGNRRSISAPKRIQAARTASKQASPLSALLSMAVLLTSGGLGFAILWATAALHSPWSAVLAMAVLLAAAVPIYLAELRNFDRFALEHRETLFAELGKS